MDRWCGGEEKASAFGGLVLAGLVLGCCGRRFEMGELAVPVQFSFADVEKMAKVVASSKLFGLQNPEQALGLMLLCQAEGLHPAIAARDYHIIEGRPSMKADAMLARFQQSGGKVEWLALTDQKAQARFSHPQGGSLDLEWNMSMAEKAGLSTRTQRDGGKNMWQKYPRQMLRARVISEGIRTVYPAVLVGVYTPEEVQDFEPTKVTQSKPEQRRTVITGPEAPWDDSAIPDEEDEELDLPVVEMITSKQVSALAIAIKEAGFDTTENGKQKGRDFVAFVLQLPALTSIKDLTKEQAQTVLDTFGSGDNGNYRADKERLEAAVNDWAGSKIPSDAELEALVETTNS
jgi:hypothetical protein